MITSETISNSSEHWLTTMTCTMCENTPDSSPLYKCPMGHLICGNCYASLRRKGSVIKCKKCFSCDLRKHQASKDFLNKLKIKPGIGRSRRYCQNELKISLSNEFFSSVDDTKENVTVEKLFRMSTTQLKQLFQLTAKERLRSKEPRIKKISDKKETYRLQNLEKGDMGEKPNYKEQVLPITLSNSDENTFEASLSKKPIVCPHNPCKKIVTISSFSQHFKYDHRDIPVFNVARGEELHMHHNAEELHFGVTYCIAVIHIQLNNESRLPLATFWVMASGSSEEDPDKAYVVYWMFTNSTDQFSSTLDVSSHLENISCSTFCSVTRIYDSCNPLNITNELNCLFLAYPSMCNLLSEGSKLNLRISIY
ncbi:hypothetical protein RN001_012573 [Aquatica leii]|uniref:Uncharacterized protein n=1 Tax=Aquatica leii TaxID=1421715 RepID=A0AAN7S7U4_9COLE|nr:hypothetical protein RN001_012573 [Aquatica leii]